MATVVVCHLFDDFRVGQNPDVFGVEVVKDLIDLGAVDVGGRVHGGVEENKIVLPTGSNATNHSSTETRSGIPSRVVLWHSTRQLIPEQCKSKKGTNCQS